jgi:hydroxylamine dehydrogenase
MDDDRNSKVMRSTRLLLTGAMIIIVVLGLPTVMMVIGTTAGRGAEAGQRPDALAISRDECVTCHREESPGIAYQFGHSAMAAAEVSCRDCHEVDQGFPGSVSRAGTYVLAQPASLKCQRCHEQEMAQYLQS